MISHSKPYITPEDSINVQNVLLSGNIAKGEMTANFEAALAQYQGSRLAFTTSSGTTALILALKALGVNENDEVIIPTYVCRNVMDAVTITRAKPVLCDIGNEWNMTAETVSVKLSSRTKAVIVVHIFGIPADTKAIKEFKIPVIEDCCQSFGAKFRNKLTGSEGDLSIYSFHATKLLTTGEGGAVCAMSMDIISEFNKLTKNNCNASPLSNIHSALGISQLQKYNYMLNTRKNIASKYYKYINAKRAMLPNSILDKSIFFRFPLLVEKLDFEDIKRQFNELGIQVRRGVDTLIHRIIGGEDNEFPDAVRAFNTTLSIPLYPALTEEEQDKIIEATNKILS